MELLLIRHALPIRRVDVDGPADPVLSDLGVQQAHHLAIYLSSEKLQAVYSSPMKRALQTAEPVAAAQGLEVLIDDDVAEYDRDSTWYIPVEELKAANDPRWQQVLAGTLGGDDFDPMAFRQQVVGAVERLIDAHPAERIAVVCHGGVINAYLSFILRYDEPQSFFYPNYTSIHRVAAARSGERSILTMNETAHLRGTGLPVGLFDG
jgi:probable phosphoglycerate mutase